MPQPAAMAQLIPQVQQADNVEVLTRIYRPDCNLAVWQRSSSERIHCYVRHLADINSQLNLRTLLGLGDVAAELSARLPQHPDRQPLIDDIHQLVDMFSCLFELPRVGLRLALLRQAMCPKFHVDRVPCRLVTTYCGPASQWLTEPTGDSPRIPPQQPEQWQQLAAGDVALLKGDGWYGNDGRGIVHRSPAVLAGQCRLFLSLDFAN
ncbi:DUF1826 domain-containing protein [Marinobacterium arenosum]|uniref:DUF1826 domain-containing protein n=1 Tax=Marinobacterium arenosum TaxID=2862496 RepID=UPI001C96789D|nr:DUF1826 domain-containing protein [Marinobacterium arenosum]MBY4677333.1 DUF1826 domain-containing protein [Marinobacterium arenosum]